MPHICLRKLPAPLQLFLAAVKSKINHAEHEEEFSKAEQYSMSIAITFNICQCPQQATAVHPAVREAGLGLPLLQGCFAGQELLDCHLYWRSEITLV